MLREKTSIKVKEEILFKNKKKIKDTQKHTEKINKNRERVLFMNSPEFYFSSSLKDVCREITKIISLNKEGIGSIHNSVYKNLNKGEVSSISSSNVIDIAKEVGSVVKKYLPEDIDNTMIKEIVEEYIFLISSGSLSSKNGCLILYSNIATDIGLFDNNSFQCVFDLEKKVKVLDKEIKAIVLLCSSSELTLHFSMLKNISVMKAGEECILKALKKKGESKTNLLKLLLDLENNIEIYRRHI